MEPLKVDTIKKSLRRIGKEDIKKYYNAKIRKLTDALILLLSIALTVIAFLPVILFVIQLLQIYQFLSGAILLILFFALLFLMFLNGVSNFFQIEIAKMIVPDEAIKEINTKAVFIYESTNLGFAIFIIAIFIFASCTL